MTDTPAPEPLAPYSSNKVEALRAEVATLRAERDDWKARFDAVDLAMGLLQEDFNAAEARLTAQAEALETLEQTIRKTRDRIESTGFQEGATSTILLEVADCIAALRTTAEAK
jgi:chromosome segregation ATPase